MFPRLFETKDVLILGNMETKSIEITLVKDQTVLYTSIPLSDLSALGHFIVAQDDLAGPNRRMRSAKKLSLMQLIGFKSIGSDNEN